MTHCSTCATSGATTARAARAATSSPTLLTRAARTSASPPSHVSRGNAPNGDMFMNYMDYVDDAAMVMFSAGQVTRMQATLDGLQLDRDPDALRREAAGGQGTAQGPPQGLPPKDTPKDPPFKEWPKDPPKILKGSPKQRSSRRISRTTPRTPPRKPPRIFRRISRRTFHEEFAKDPRESIPARRCPSDLPPKSVFDPSPNRSWNRPDFFPFPGPFTAWRCRRRGTVYPGDRCGRWSRSGRVTPADRHAGQRLPAAFGPLRPAARPRDNSTRLDSCGLARAGGRLSVPSSIPGLLEATRIAIL